MTVAAAKKNDEINFEEALARLEKIVKELESGEAPLDRSLELYEEGTSLVRVCSKALENAEKKIKMLTLSENGVSETDFVSRESEQ